MPEPVPKQGFAMLAGARTFPEMRIPLTLGGTPDASNFKSASSWIAARIASTAAGDACPFEVEASNEARCGDADVSTSAVRWSKAEARRFQYWFEVEWRTS